MVTRVLWQAIKCIYYNRKMIHKIALKMIYGRLYRINNVFFTNHDWKKRLLHIMVSSCVHRNKRVYTFTENTLLQNRTFSLNFMKFSSEYTLKCFNKSFRD